VTPAIIAAVIAAGRAAGALLAADAQGNLAQYAGFDLVKCNRAEAEAELGVLLDVDADYERGLARLLPRLGARMCVITRGPEGLSAQEQGQPAMHLAAANRSEVFDVTGAGDTVVAVLALAVAAGLSLRIAAHLANAAAGLVVRRVGNAVVTPAELAAAIESSQ
jgi:rfaE bifunctional protein kinase chain/domain